MLVPEIYIDAPDHHHWSIRLWDESSDAQVAYHLQDLRQLWHALGATLESLENGFFGAVGTEEDRP